MTTVTRNIAAEVANRIINEKHLLDYAWMTDTSPYILIHRDDEASREVYLHDIIHQEVSKLKSHELCDIIWSWDEDTPYEFFNELDHRDNSTELVDPKRMLARLAGWCVHEAAVDLIDPFHWASPKP